MDFDTIDKPLPNPWQPLKEKNWNGTLINQNSIDKLLKNKIIPYESFNNEQQEFIKKFTTALHTAASEQSIEKFHNFLKTKAFETFDQLVDTINIHNEQYPNSYIDVPFDAIKNNTDSPTWFKEVILKIYNTLSYFFGKDYGYKILRILDVEKNLSNSKNTTVLGYATMSSARGKKNQVSINEKILTFNEQNLVCNWKSGCKSTPDKFNTFIHEFGHIIDYVHSIRFPFFKEINSLSVLDTDTSNFTIHIKRYVCKLHQDKITIIIILSNNNFHHFINFANI